MELTLDQYRERIAGRRWIRSLISAKSIEWNTSFSVAFENPEDVEKFLVEKLGEPSYTFQHRKGACTSRLGWLREGWELILEPGVKSPELYVTPKDATREEALTALQVVEDMLQVGALADEAALRWGEEVGLLPLS